MGLAPFSATLTVPSSASGSARRVHGAMAIGIRPRWNVHRRPGEGTTQL